MIIAASSPVRSGVALFNNVSISVITWTISVCHLDCMHYEGMDHLCCSLLNLQIVIRVRCTRYILNKRVESVTHASLGIPKDTEIKMVQSHHRWLKHTSSGSLTHSKEQPILWFHKFFMSQAMSPLYFETKMYISMDPRALCGCFFYQEEFPHLPLQVFQCCSLLSYFRYLWKIIYIYPKPLHGYIVHCLP